MSFFVSLSDLAKLTGRTPGSLQQARRTGKIPAQQLPNGSFGYDFDDPVINGLLCNLPKGLTEEQAAAADAYQRDLNKRRKKGELACLVTGEFDLFGDVTDDYTSDYDDEEDSSEGGRDLDIKKKEKDIEYREEQIKKLKLTHEAMKGGLIERAYASSYIGRYLGALHQRHLELAATGIINDLYSAAHRLEDSRAAMKEMEKLLSLKLSDILKGAIATMERNPL